MSENCTAGSRGGWRKALSMLVKIVLAAAIIWYLVAGHAEDFRKGLENFNYFFLIPASVAYLAHMFVCGWRWYKLAAVIGVPISLWEAVAVTMQGYFWSLVIPGGAIGGDFARVAIIARRMPRGEKAEGVLSILMDRIVGMVALFAMTIVLVAVSIPQLMNVEIDGFEPSDTFKIVCISGLVLLCLCGISAMLVLFFHRQVCRIGWIAALFEFGDRRTDGMVTRTTATLDLYAKSWKALAWLTFISVIFIHLMTVVAVIFLIYGLGCREVPILEVITAVTVGNIVGLIPLTVSGIGLRDAAILILLRSGGVREEAAAVVPVMYTCLILAFNIFAAVFFICGSGCRREAGEGR